MMMVFGLVPLLILFLGFGAFKAFRRNAGDAAQLANTGAVLTGRLDGAVFGLAKRLRGKITLSDVVVETGLDLADAERYMDSLVDHAHVSMEIDGNGRLIYEFPEFLDRSGGNK